MDFIPKTRQEAEKESAFPVWDAGVYDFEVGKAEEQTSKKGNDMIKLSLNVYDDENRVQVIFDYLMPSFPIKLIDACEALNLSEEYQTGKLDAYQFEGKTGKLRLKVRGETTNQSTGEKYPPKNEVESYVLNAPTNSASQVNTDIDDPFNYA